MWIFIFLSLCERDLSRSPSHEQPPEGRKEGRMFTRPRCCSTMPQQRRAHSSLSGGRRGLVRDASSAAEVVGRGGVEGVLVVGRGRRGHVGGRAEGEDAGRGPGREGVACGGECEGAGLLPEAEGAARPVADAEGVFGVGEGVGAVGGLVEAATVGEELESRHARAGPFVHGDGRLVVEHGVAGPGEPVEGALVTAREGQGVGPGRFVGQPQKGLFDGVRDFALRHGGSHVAEADDVLAMVPGRIVQHVLRQELVRVREFGLVVERKGLQRPQAMAPRVVVLGVLLQHHGHELEFVRGVLRLLEHGAPVVPHLVIFRIVARRDRRVLQLTSVQLGVLERVQHATPVVPHRVVRRVELQKVRR
mmetsp:Transcript_9096/g.27897  ORF Transcript_9096/g.27897 Transcript_9096/m.27897 type:complete len:362 (-) Transcript_9096:253-1338(-)